MDDSPDRSPLEQTDMATMVAVNGSVPNMPGPPGGLGTKRYRPAPAKTFQCRGYGECRMVFSRSEHLARHIRKHTGERPFSCHCSKQFSRLDNLRQHAQTVHADKQEQNERMMRDLTSLHATMAAANKVGGTASTRVPKRMTLPSSTPLQLSTSQSTSNGSNGSPTSSTSPEGFNIKQEELGVVPIHHRPGTTAGYESEVLYGFDERRQYNTGSGAGQSFRDPSQSFLAPSDSFRPGSSHEIKSLPPLSAVVSASLPAPGYYHEQQQQQQQLFSFLPSTVLPFPVRRPTTSSGSRPGTAPASSSAAFFAGRPFSAGLGHSSLLHAGFAFGLGGGTSSEIPTADPSPFYFHPPGLDSAATSPNNSRKRAFTGPDGPYDELRGDGSGTLDVPAYEYGSESRPQSRRLSVMELCNDADALASAGALAHRPPSSRGTFTADLLSAAAAAVVSDPAYASYHNAPGYGSTSRPTTSSGLVSSASALHIFDRSPSARSHSGSPPHQQPRLFARSGGGDPGAGVHGYGSVPPPGGRPSPPANGGGLSSSPRGGRRPSPQTAAAPSPHGGPDGARNGGGRLSAANTPVPAFAPFAASASFASSSASFTPPSASILSSPAFRPQQYQFAHSPTFSNASAASASPRSPLSDGSSHSGSPSPFATHPGLYDPRLQHHHQHHQQQQQQQQQQQAQFHQYGGY